jgi:hypothetical protein
MKMHLKSAIVLLGIWGMLLSGCGSESNSVGGASQNNASGQGGSTARFAMSGDYLYTLSGYQLKTFNIQEPANPKAWSEVTLTWDVETLFTYKNNLFVGSETGVFIYDISDPAFPKKMSQFSHVRSCDPVVVQDNFAYVTLRNTTRCGGAANQLDILDITDIAAPKLVKSYPMQAPYGLAIDGKNLFICDGTSGLKLFNVEDPSNIKIVEQRDQTICFDLIARNNLLITTGDSGILQLDYAGTPMIPLSTIEIQREPS